MEEVKIGHVDVKSVMTKSSLPVGGYSVNPYVLTSNKTCNYRKTARNTTAQKP